MCIAVSEDAILIGSKSLDKTEAIVSIRTWKMYTGILWLKLCTKSIHSNRYIQKSSYCMSVSYTLWRFFDLLLTLHSIYGSFLIKANNITTRCTNYLAIKIFWGFSCFFASVQVSWYINHYLNEIRIFVQNQSFAAVLQNWCF